MSISYIILVKIEKKIYEFINLKLVPTKIYYLRNPAHKTREN